MSTTQSDFNEMVEQCETCDAKTPHRVSVELVTEGDEGENVAYSREPYRVSECTQCGRTTHQRMNNA